MHVRKKKKKNRVPRKREKVLLSFPFCIRAIINPHYCSA